MKIENSYYLILESIKIINNTCLNEFHIVIKHISIYIHLFYSSF